MAVRQWKRTLNELAGDRRAGLVGYAAAYTSDSAEAARVVDQALVAVLAQRRGPSDAAAVEARARLEVRRIFAGARRGGSRVAARGGGGASRTAAASPPIDSDPGTLVARVRRRRLLRLSVVGAATVAILGLGVATVYGLGRIDPSADPAPPPAPADAADVVPAPAPEPEILGPVTVAPLLPEVLPLRAGMLEAAGPGWSLVQYENEAVAGGLIYLVGPGGERYEVPTPLAGPGAQGGRLREWLPGTTLVLVRQWRGAGEETDVVDLLTGERLLTVHHSLAGEHPEEYWATIAFVGDGSTDVLVSFSHYVNEPPTAVALTARLGLDGRELAALEDYRGGNVDGTDHTLSPDGTRFALHRDGGLEVLSTSDFAVVSRLASPYPNRPADCGVRRWAGPDQLLLTCRGPETDEWGNRTHLEVWVAPADGGPPVRIASMAGWLQEAWQAGDQVVIGTWDDDGAVSQVVRPDGTLDPLPGGAFATITASAGGVIYAWDEEFEGYWADQALVAIDPATGAVDELFGAHGDYDRIVAVVTHGDS